MPPRVLVWDAPTRLFHWGLAALVVVSYATAKLGGTWLEWHMRSGYAVLALLLFRIAWGFAGGSTARFASFVRGPRSAAHHLRERLARREPAFVGHNPFGGWMVVLMLLVLFAQALSGLFVDDEIATQGPLYAKASGALVERMNQLHHYNEWVIVGMVALHVVAVLAYQFGLRIDLIRPMLHGRAPLPPGVEAPRPGSWPLAAVALAASCALVYWLVVVYPRMPS
jgi:cytochrome b